MASGDGFSYRPNVNRNVTKKWREASRPTYDDDDWGDDGYGTYENPLPPPLPAQAPGRPGWGGQLPPPNRSFTNPSPPRSTGRQSFDRGDDRRHVSVGTGFDSAYPSTQRSPFPEPQHEDGPPQRFYAQHPALHLNTQGPPGPYPPNFRPGSRGSQRPPYDAPFSAPGGYGQQRSHSGNRSIPGLPSQRQGSPDSRTSNTSGKYFPPRKSSLSQEQPPPPPSFQPLGTEPDSEQPTSPSGPVKPLPFIRPSDIYRRMEEEKERERKSMESSRPSLDLTTTKSRDSAKTSTDQDATMGDGDVESSRRLKPALDPVPERKSEYGFDSMLKKADPTLLTTSGDGVHRQDTTASSVYTDRPDPVSASTDDNEQDEPASAFSYQSSSLPVDRQPAPDVDLTRSVTQNELTQVDSSKSTALPAANNGPTTVPQTGLGHAPSLGYRSVVQQAFDDSQNQGGKSPTASTSDTIPRSNSASTSEISPIISRKNDLVGGPSGPPVTEQTIPEEPATNRSERPLSNVTIKAPSATQAAPPNTTASLFQPGYRRDVTPPSRGENSPARHADVRHSNEAKGQRGVLASSASTDDVTLDEGRGRGPEASSTSLTSPSASQASGVSEEFQQWQAHSNQFNSKFGTLNSTSGSPKIGSPKISSPILRSESPPKGTVKDLAGRYNTSGRSTPVGGLDDQEPLRPAAQARLESFRPSIPGGWQSYTATPSSQTPQLEAPNKRLQLSGQSYPSTDSIPTAKAPSDWQTSPQSEAFAAAAAAGTALAGSFNGPAMTDRRADTSEDESENEWDQSSTSSKPEAVQSATRDFAAISTTKLPLAGSQNASTGVPPHTGVLLKDAGRDDHADTPGAESTHDYFPAPLRTSRSVEPTGTMRPPIPIVNPAQHSPIHGNDEELQNDIVKSLTPRSSNFEGAPGSLTGPSSEVKTPTKVNESRESDDMYGGISGSRTPHTENDRYAVPDFGHQPQVSKTSPNTTPTRPFLEQRFSWEMESDTKAEADPISSPGQPHRSITPPVMTATDVSSPETPRLSTKADDVDPVISPASPEFPHNVRTSNDAPQLASDISKRSSGTQAPNLPTSPTAAKSFWDIVKIGDQTQRINAFEDSRHAYGQSDGALDHWIQSMQGPEHADIFQANGRTWQDTGKTTGPGTAQRAPSNRPLANISGGKIMQEDGKKLMAAAGRFGGKAGVAAKGLFAKGKDKLRAASASEKASPDKRKSTDVSSTIPENEYGSKRDSSSLSAPQIPAQNLQSSPIDETKWFGFDRENTLDAGPVNISGRSANHNVGQDFPQAGVQHNTDSGRSIAPRDGPTNANVVDRSSKAVPTVQIGRSATSRSTDQSSGVVDTAVKAHASSEGVRHERKVSDLTDDERVHPGLLAENMQRHNLDVAGERRQSNVSAVSSASPSLVAQNHHLTTRSISPSEPTGHQAESAPGYSDVQEDNPQPSSKEEEAALERGTGTDDPVPRYEETAPQSDRPPRIGPDTQIMPVADLSQQRRPEPSTVSTRPFSFEGSEALRQAQQAYVQSQQVQNDTSQPLSPVSQAASKTLSQVSVEEVADERPAKQNRQSKSYSRPFGTDPVGDHPAFRQPKQPLDRGQMYSTEAHLPSSQRPRDPAPQQRQQLRPAEDQGYRIPGPYGQEYRSPKPKSTPTPSPTAAHGQQQSMPPAQLTKTHSSDPPGPTQYPQPQQYQNQSQPQYTNMGPPPPVQDDPRSKPRGFGSFFRSRSKQALDRDSSRDRDASVEREKRPSFFPRGSRQDSVVSHQSSQNESRDVVTQLPPPSNKSRNRLSKDMRAASPVVAPDVKEGKKKKRFSAMGNLFSRSDKTENTMAPQRSMTLPYNSVQPDRGQPHQQAQQYRPQHDDPRHYQQQPYTAPVDRSYGDQQQQQYETDHPRDHGPPPPQQSRYEDRPHQRNYDDRSQQHNHPANHVPHSPSRPHDNQPRPSDLRIDTSGGHYNVANHPYTAPPHFHPFHHTEAQPAHPSHHAPPTTRAPQTAGASAATPSPSRGGDGGGGGGGGGISSHVLALHKRARSPTTEARRRSQLAPPGFENDDAAAGGEGPVEGLGTFRNKKYSPVDGAQRGEEAQEGPWRIGLPDEGLEEGTGGEGGAGEGRKGRRVALEWGSGERDRDVDGAGNGGRGEGQTVADRMMAPSSAARSGREDVADGLGMVGGGVEEVKTPPLPVQSPLRGRRGDGEGVVDVRKPQEGETGRDGGYVAELPGSKAAGYESEEEVLMSATAGPGDWSYMPAWIDDTK